MNDAIPAPIALEHQGLRATLERAKREGGLLGLRARELADVIEPHFDKEEQLALPPLALLPKLAWRGAGAEMAEILPLTRRLAAELPLMVMEHKQIGRAVEAFESAARDAHRTEYQRFAEAITTHTQQEEEVLYPAAVLVGAYLELKLSAERAVELG